MNINLRDYYSIIYSEKKFIRNPILSVILISYNHEQYLEYSFQSIIKSKTKFNFEILITDDNSTDNSIALLKTFQKSYPSFVKLLFSKENLSKYGSPGSLNTQKAYLESKGKYIALLEGDDYWTDPNKLQKQVDYLESNPKVSCCATDFDQINKNGVFEKNPEPYPETVKLNTKSIVRAKWSPLQTCTLMFKRETLKPIPLFLFDELIVCGDWALSCWFSTKGEVHILPDTTCTKRMDSGGVWTSKPNILNAYRLICFSSRMPRYFPSKYKQYFHQNLVRDMPIFLEQLIHLQNFKESCSYIFALIKIPIHISFIPSITKTFLIIVMNTIRMRKFSFQ